MHCIRLRVGKITRHGIPKKIQQHTVAYRYTR